MSDPPRSDAPQSAAPGSSAPGSGGPGSAAPRQTIRPGLPWRAIAVIGCVFLLGGAAGVAVGRAWATRDFGARMGGPPSQARAMFRIEAMKRHLDLSDAQADQVREVVTKAESDREDIMRSCGPELDDLRTKTNARIREILNEEQRKKFDEIEERRRKHPHPRGRKGPPPP